MNLDGVARLKKPTCLCFFFMKMAHFFCMMLRIESTESGKRIATLAKLANGILVQRSTLNLGGSMSFNDMNSVGTPAYPLKGFGIHLFGKGNRPYWAHINEMWWTMTFNNCKTGIYANPYSAEVDNTIVTNGIFSAAGTANTYQCNCIDNTHVGAQFYDMSDFTNAVRGNNFNTHTTGLQLGNAGIGDVFIGRQNRTGNIWD